ncbi:MAG: hypothetical protein OJF51_004170 [Nitrospira sp.]|nr:MAG: hypothetical protein OJF51_004170 [Nitrospira sp.]
MNGACLWEEQLSETELGGASDSCQGEYELPITYPMLSISSGPPNVMASLQLLNHLSKELL